MNKYKFLFLQGRRGFDYIDRGFKNLVELFHQIPFCATFGGSCSGHLDVENGWDISMSSSGHLRIIVFPGEHHIQELLKRLRAVIELYKDASFEIENEVRYYTSFCSDEGCKIFREERGTVKIDREYPGAYALKFKIGKDNLYLPDILDYYFYPIFPIDKKCRAAYKETRENVKEVKLFWKILEKAVFDFCKEHRFNVCDIEQRIKEFESLQKGI
ncbi:hypothetical protein HZC33_02650 [Candidatus Wolfebacteria bacterium]|nr:hypothetical protein [Candidatus Wolfebacteria bacterium]